MFKWSSIIQSFRFQLGTRLGFHQLETGFSKLESNTVPSPAITGKLS